MSGSWIGGQNSFHPCEDDAYKMSCRRVGAHNGRSRRRRGRRLLECSGVLLRVSAAGRRPRHHRSVERSTTRTNWLDGVETEWTNRTSEDPPDPMGQRPPPCQGEGRGFEVRLPLQQSTWSAAKNAVAASRPVAPVFSSSLGSAEAWSCRYWSLPCRTRFRAPRWGRPRQLRRSSGPSGERSGRWSSVRPPDRTTQSGRHVGRAEVGQRLERDGEPCPDRTPPSGPAHLCRQAPSVTRYR